MFDIIIKRKKLVVDCFTNNPAIFEYFPITHASKNYPDWWKKMETSFSHTSPNSGLEISAATIKRCDGLLSLYSKGFHLKLWSDLILETTGQGEFRYQYAADETYPVISHVKRQIGPAFESYTHVKILSPWIIEEKSGTDFLFTGATWNHPDKLFNWNIIPGCVNFKNQSSTHINLFMPLQVSRLELKAGEPMAHIIPISEKEIELKCHQLTKAEFENKMVKHKYMSSFMGTYKKKH